MSFHDDIRLPVDIDRHPTGGPQFNTTILKLFSGKERRNKNWQRSLGTWTIAYGETEKSNLIDIINTFYAVNGQADGFRLKDWSDFQIGDTLGGDTSTKQAIGTGDGINNIFQIYKSYSMGSTTFLRIITRPVVGTLRVFIGSSEKIISVDWTVDFTTGLITFLATAAVGTLTLTGQPLNTETVVIGSKTYTFQSSLTNTDGHVHIGASTAASLTNLIHAINNSGGVSGTDYAAATTVNTDVIASQGAGTTMVLTAIHPGTVGNSVGTTETLTNGSFGAATLTGGTGSVPGISAIVNVMTEFDIPVRFATDVLSIDTDLFSSEAIISIPQINVQELKE